MPATILSVPSEILLNILSLLNPFDLDNVAKTFNRHLYNAAATLLAPLNSWVQNARRMCALFPPRGDKRLRPAYPGHIRPFQGGWHAKRIELPDTHGKRLGLDHKAGRYVFTGPPDLHWMKLNGSFDWLQRLDKATAEEMRPHNGVEGDESPSPRNKVTALAREAKLLGLTLPAGFRKFFTSNRLHHRIPSSSAWFFALSELIECPPSIYNSAGGYLLRFHFDQQSCAFAYLYMNTCGNHCVLYSGVDVYECLEASEKGDDASGSLINKEFSMAGLTFEEYLVSVYFEGLLNFEAVPSDGLRDYVAHVYRPVPRSNKGAKKRKRASRNAGSDSDWSPAGKA